MSNLNGTLPALQDAYQALADYAASQGISIGIADYGGLRTQADTAKILGYRQADFAADVKAGRVRPDTTLQRYRPIAQWGHSYHDFGAAFDIQVVARPSSMTTGQVQRLLGAYAPQVGLRWGGTFPDPDPPHFELAESLAQAAQDWQVTQASGAESGAGPMSGGPTSVFDTLASGLAKFLPGLTPAVDPSAMDDASSDNPLLDDPAQTDGGDPADDAGASAVTATMPAQSPMMMYALAGVVVLGAIAWALAGKLGNGGR